MEFPTQEKIKEIQVGDSHNLMLSEDNLLYANGDNTSGQVDGDLENFLYYLCTPKIVPLQIEPGVKIEKMWARNNRSAALLSNGDLCYWGGFSYHPDYGLKNLPKYDGINIFNREEGIPANSKMIDIGLGIFHDILLVEEF